MRAAVELNENDYNIRAIFLDELLKFGKTAWYFWRRRKIYFFVINHTRV